MINFCGTMKMAGGMTCYKKGLSDKAVAELNKMGLEDARGNADKLDGKPTLDTANIDAINDMGIEYYLPHCDENVFLRFNNMKLKQADMDSFLLAYNSVKDNNVHIDVCV